ncbi:MAG: membrane protein insertase YidC [Deltaproteobacteria bacterium]|nr:membrane protein insertase YidC [Deltaproteobacteria bacterium]
MDTEKRILFAIVLSMGLLFAYPYIVNWINPPKPKPVAVVETVQTNALPSVGAVKTVVKTGTMDPAPIKQAQPVKEALTIVETPLFKAVITSKGGAIKRWELKQYNVTNTPDAPKINLSETIAKNGSLATRLVVNGQTEEISFSTAHDAIKISEGARREVVFTGRNSAGITIEKRFSFDASSYIVDVKTGVVNGTKTGFDGGINTALLAGTAGKDETGYHTGPIIRTKEKLLRPDAETQKLTGSGNADWLGVETKYFMSVFMAKDGKIVNWTAEAPSKTASKVTLDVPLAIAPGARAETSYSVFLGPKDYNLLVQLKNGFDEAIEFGMFAFMARPSLIVLNFFKNYAGNYGLAIIILTVLIKILFYPLTAHSLKSMKGMQQIQPQLLAIKEKYKDNKEKLNKEMMELYKRYKINPVGGCLPMVLQIPVFLALYEVLYVAIELRHAPLFLWIQDLSDKDPYYIAPLLMGATMFVQQKMTPTTADPMQAKIMLLMPVIFTFMFLSFPSGLVLYWFVNNLLSIAQQYQVQRSAQA